MNEEWIDYWKKDENGNRPEIPDEGYVEYINTFDVNTRYVTDMSVRTSENLIIWNRAAPICVSKFRFVSKDFYNTIKIKALESQILGLEQKIKNLKKEIDACSNEI